MHRAWTRLTFVVLILSSYQEALALRSLKLDITKNQSIVVEVPPGQWEKKDISWTGSIPIYVLRVGANFIQGGRWENGNLPQLVEFHLEKAQDCGSGVMSGRTVGCLPNWKQVELRSADVWLKIQFSPEISDVEAALKQIAFIGSLVQFENSSYLHDKVFLPNQAKAFVALPTLGVEDRYQLFKAGVTEGCDVSSTSFKGIGYLLLDVPTSTTFNTLRVSQDERVAGVIRDVVIRQAKEVLPLAEGKSIGGLAFHLSIPAYNFVTGGEAKFDDLLVYLKIEDLREFSSSDITSQKLIDDSFVLLNSDRIEAKL
jgi:hypothetical protein